MLGNLGFIVEKGIDSENCQLSRGDFHTEAGTETTVPLKIHS